MHAPPRVIACFADPGAPTDPPAEPGLSDRLALSLCRAHVEERMTPYLIGAGVALVLAYALGYYVGHGRGYEYGKAGGRP